MTLAAEFSRVDSTDPAAPSAARLRAVIAARLRANVEAAAAHEATARELTGHTDPDSTIERELAQACAARALEAVRDGEDALRRLDARTYGTCEACRRPIAPERLEAVPEARRCVSCPGERSRRWAEVATR